MPEDGEWTHVRRKGRNKNAPARKPVPHSLPEKFEPRTTGTLRPPEALRADYDKIHTQWQESTPHEALIKLVDSHAKELRIQRAVCLGIGTFDPEDGAWETKRAAYVQLCALSTLTSQFAKYNKEPIECIFQEPIFTESDKRFITDLGHTIVESPAAYERIDQHTLLIGVHLYRPIYAEALKSCLPAIFIGTGWDVWDTVTMEKSNDLANMKIMDRDFSRHDFPQDASSTAFSSTSIYFKPPGTQEDPAPESPASERDTPDNGPLDKSCKSLEKVPVVSDAKTAEGAVRDTKDGPADSDVTSQDVGASNPVSANECKTPEEKELDEK